jgi:hypothetical protein
VLPFRHIFAIIEPADFCRDLSFQRLMQVALDLEALSDQVLILRIDDPPIAIPDLDPRDLRVQQCCLQTLVYPFELVVVEALGQVQLRDGGLDSERGDKLSRVGGALEGPPLDAILDELTQAPGEHDYRNRAGDCEFR